MCVSERGCECLSVVLTVVTPFDHFGPGFDRTYLGSNTEEDLKHIYDLSLMYQSVIICNAMLESE